MTSRKSFAIRNYGIFWDREEFELSGLIGYASGYPHVDFSNQSGIYVLFDGEDPVYVGQAGSSARSNLSKRLTQHTKNHLFNRWDMFSWFGLCAATKTGELSRADEPDRRIQGTVASALNDIEGALICALEPRLNKQGAKFAGAAQFDQLVSDREDIEEEILEEVRAISERQASLENRLIVLLNRIESRETGTGKKAVKCE